MASKDNIKDIQDHNIDIEQIFEPEDCTMVMEDYGKCQDYPCDDCVKRFLNSRCKNCWGEEKHKDNTWDMCKSCADEVHKELGGFVYPWNKEELSYEEIKRINEGR